MTPEQERLVEAFEVQRYQGPNSQRWIAARIRALTLAGDEAGAQRYRETARAYEQLLPSHREPS